jgi:tRNA pseudouridine32 synthase/23S rRNA pseudouridine746 synthase
MSDRKDHAEAHVVIESPDDRPIDLLGQATGLSKQRIKLAMTQGAVWMSAKRALRAGDELHLYYDAAILAEVPPEPNLVADIGAYSVWCKPRGLRSQGSKWGDHCTVVRWAERHLRPERSALTVHRLDRRLFRERDVEKRYRAVVSGDFSEQADPLRVEMPVDEKYAVSQFSLMEVSDDRRCSMIDVRIETGRKHQIRRHLAKLGYPIIGDRLYGSGVKDGVDLQLTAYLLAFHCPVADTRVEYRLGDEWLPKTAVTSTGAANAGQSSMP